MFDFIKVSKNEFDLYEIFENEDLNFQFSINSNPKIKAEIKKSYHRTLNNKAKFMIDAFHLNIIWATEEIIKNNSNAFQLVNSLVSYISSFFDDIETKLRINNNYELKRLNFILQLTSITIQNAVDYNDVELAFESFYQLEID